MSLPTGYTQLEYIESSGTQYIDTGFKPNQDTGVEVTVRVPTIGVNTMICGARNSTTSQNYTILVNTSGDFRQGYNNTVYTGGAADTNQHTIKADKNLFYVDGQLANTATYATFTAYGNMYLFAVNAPTVLFGNVQIYSCQIYDNGTLVRAFVPCKNTAGTVGLYDTVNAAFYANAGTGTFTAGPEIIPATTPTNFRSILAVVLAWTASEAAESYNLYRNGTLIGTTTATQYVDTSVESDMTYIYSVTAVNATGESAAASVTVYTKTGYFEYKPLIRDANFQ